VLEFFLNIGIRDRKLGIRGRIQGHLIWKVFTPQVWWTATLASDKNLARFRIEEAKNKSFKTNYYNVDIHKASFMLPTFLKETLTF